MPEDDARPTRMTPDQLDQRIHEEYNIPVESREVMKP